MIPVGVVTRKYNNHHNNQFILNEKQGRLMVATLSFDVLDFIFYANFVPTKE